MRGRCNPQSSMPAIVDLGARIPAGHPLRTVKRFADRALAQLSPAFDRMYAASGRPSIPPECLLKASLLIALYSIRSARACCEELDYHLLYRWFLDMNMLDPGYDASTFAKNRERLLRHKVAAGLKSVRPKDGRHVTDPAPDDPGNPTVDFRLARFATPSRHCGDAELRGLTSRDRMDAVGALPGARSGTAARSVNRG